MRLIRWVLAGMVGLGLSAQVLQAQAPGAVSLRTAVDDRNHDHLPDRLGSQITVVVMVTQRPEPDNDTTFSTYVQDSTAGARLVGPVKGMSGLRIGDIVRVTGTMSHHLATAQIDGRQIEVQQRGLYPAPPRVSVRDLLSEEYEGQLVRVKGDLRITDLDGEPVVMLEDGTGMLRVRIRDSITRIPRMHSLLARANQVEIVGIARQRATDRPYEGRFILQPRDAADITFLRRSMFAWIAGCLLVAVLCGTIVHLRLRQRQTEKNTRQLSGLASELQASEDAYRRSERRYRSLTENSEDGVAVIGRDGMIIFSTPAFDRLIGASTGNAIGVSLWRVVSADEEPAVQKAITDLVFRSESSASLELSCMRLTGGVSQLDIRLTNLMLEPSVNGIVLNVRDVTERRVAERALAASEDRSRQSQRLEVVGRLAGGIAHDFNNLLTVMRGHAELLLSTACDGQTRTHVEQIHASADRGATMTRQLLAFSRQQVLQPRTVQPNDIVGGMQPMLSRLIGEHIELVAQTDRPVSHVRVDPAQLEMAILNLVINARDAMPTGGRITIGAMQEPALVGETANVLIWVEDDGCGMDNETLSHAYEPFFTTKEFGKGTGLGLPSVYGFVQQSGGQIHARSSPGVGTRFEIRLPAVAAEVEPTALAFGIADLSGHTVLLVEDEVTVRDLIRRFLEFDGCKVIEASSGCEALEIWGLRGSEIDLVISDVVMPGSTGPELAAAIHARSANVPFLLMSGYTQDALDEFAPAEGLRVLEKPFSRQELNAAMQEVLAMPLRDAA
jgi:PAS domain S-box-containing protein